jgi:pyruvate dehydrogenase E2 component (dihydrolipoamide acetyltransferase)
VSGATLVAMPRLSDSMEEGTIVRWLKADGDAVARGDELVEIETDKATMTFEADGSGVLRRLAAEGDTVALGAPIAELLAPGGMGAPPPDAAFASAPAAPASVPAGPPASAPAAAPPASPGARVPASPLARRIAITLGIDLATLVGSGPHGRVVKRDVERAATAGGRAAVAPPAPGAESAKGSVESVEPTRVQATIARRMAESRATVPDFSVEVDVRADALVELRAAVRGQAGPDDAVPSYNDFVVKACAAALRAHPRVNGAFRDGRFEYYERVNVGVAVAAPGALLVPVVADADRKPLGAIAAETRRLAGRAREGTLTPPELSGGTFTVSNLGMLGVTRFTAVINQPQAAILAVGAMERRPLVGDDDAIVAAHAMTLTLCADHRILYGADAAAFLATVRSTLEAPLRLLL